MDSERSFLRIIAKSNKRCQTRLPIPFAMVWCFETSNLVNSNNLKRLAQPNIAI